MPALPTKADICSGLAHVRVVPKATLLCALRGHGEIGLPVPGQVTLVVAASGLAKNVRLTI